MRLHPQLTVNDDINVNVNAVVFWLGKIRKYGSKVKWIAVRQIYNHCHLLPLSITWKKDSDQSQIGNISLKSGLMIFGSALWPIKREKIPSEIEVAPRYNCWHCWHCLHCWCGFWFLNSLAWVTWRAIYLKTGLSVHHSNTIVHYWALLNTIQHYSTLLNAIEHYWILLNTAERYWTLLNTIEH